MDFKRQEYKLIRDRLKEPRKFIQVLTGPRQVGKTTVVKQVLDDIDIPWLYFSADATSQPNRTWISVSWDAARERLRREALGEVILVIDEIQKIKGWSEIVKKEWDDDSFNDRQVKLLLLGSSRVLLQSGLSDSLAGRFEEIRMGHWRYAEMRDCFGFSLEKYLYYGGFPGAASFSNDEDRFRAYVQSAIVDATVHKDILMEAPVRKPALLEQAFILGVSYSGQILSLNKMLGSLQDAGNTVTLANYLSLLDQSGLLRGLGKFSIDASRRRASIPKFQTYDNALKILFTPTTFQGAQLDRALWGNIFESGIGAYIINQAFLHRFEAYYWREGSDEVDFVLRKNGRVVAIEVKSNAQKNSRGLERFSKEFNPHKAFIVGKGWIAPEEFLTTELDGIF